VSHLIQLLVIERLEVRLELQRRVVIEVVLGLSTVSVTHEISLVVDSRVMIRLNIGRFLRESAI